MTRACLTLDLEFDHDGVARRRSHDALDAADRTIDALGPLNVPLTAFVTGAVLMERPGVLQKVGAVPCEFESHSLHHVRRPPGGRAGEIRECVKLHEAALGKRPIGYRAPFGEIGGPELKALAEEGFSYDSSRYGGIGPVGSWSPGRSSRPFVYEGMNLAEISISALPSLPLPVSLSYIQFFGLSFYRAVLARGGFPDPLVFNFHLHDTCKSPAWRSLPAPWKLYYARNRLSRSPLLTLVRFVEFLKGSGYEFVLMSELSKAVGSSI